MDEQKMMFVFDEQMLYIKVALASCKAKFSKLERIRYAITNQSSTSILLVGYSQRNLEGNATLSIYTPFIKFNFSIL